MPSCNCNRTIQDLEDYIDKLSNVVKLLVSAWYNADDKQRNKYIADAVMTGDRVLQEHGVKIGRPEAV